LLRWGLTHWLIYCVWICLHGMDRYSFT